MTLQGVNIIAVFLLCQKAFVDSALEECSGEAEYSILGMMLRRHIYKKITGAQLGDVCLRECYRDVRCQSFNYVISKEMCELNNRTKEARPEHFVSNSDRYYFKRDKDRVRLGSIPDLPATSCKEIKASEREWADSGNYWLLFLEIEKLLLAYCDMETEDIDECVSGVHDCHSLASCTNTVGSFSCSCNHPYTGDGKTCMHPVAECQNYQSLTSADRKVTYTYHDISCDNGLGPGWFRFQGAAGTRMTTSCPPAWRCNSHGTGWMNGGHPTVANGNVTRQVCFSWDGNCCHHTTKIQVRNCSSYYVYYFNGTGGKCQVRYCGTD